MTQTLSVSRLANLGAGAIFTAFDSYITRFREITCRAQARFEQRDWAGMRTDMAERLELYRQAVDPTVAEVRALLADRLDQKLLWASMKAVYSGRIADCHQWELAETFFNSITRRIFATVGVDAEIEFVDTDFDSPPTRTEFPVYRLYPASSSLSGLLEAILTSVPLRAPYMDLQRDTRLGAETLAAQLIELDVSQPVQHAEIINSIFFRGAAAYVIGRLFFADRVVPLALSLRHPDGGLILDAVLLHENDVSILFSFAHSYFHVEAERPYDMVRQLRLILPRKRIAELYISIGFNKQGKTELYRDLLHHAAHTTDRFDLAPGERGMVMAVFTMPSYDVVFKIIRDRFVRPKSTTRQQVMAKYQLVYRNDRAGRLVDAQEFEHLTFPRALFAGRLLDHLARDAARTVTVEGENVHIRHCYVERRVTPLNLYIREAEGEAARAAVIDYGRCIKDLMAVNIFPGDLLLKNFGVTSNARVVFYDYDEVTLLTDCRIRDMPAGRSMDEELADQPWGAVGENDVFPEEFARFLGLHGPLRDVFLQEHADLLESGAWRAIQARHRAGEMLFITPYAESRRLRPGTPSA
jgi:isocitrate dehydrogenase kinase/phosphatase